QERTVPIFKREDREAVGAGALAFAFLAAVIASLAFVMAAHADTRKVGTAAGNTQVTLTEFAISPSMITVPAGGKLDITNSGTVNRSFLVEGTTVATKELEPGESQSLDLKDVKQGTYIVSCTIPGHKQAGMVAMLHLGAGADMSSAASGADQRAQSDANDA